MRIGILGTGDMADALGTQWARAGYELLIGGRTPSRAAALAERIGARGPDGRKPARGGRVRRGGAARGRPRGGAADA
ncbi:NAD(P)-binding domain-containing protein [Streptomyces sp. 7N604]|uniref:NAD(P)-binding domain-containing protein n=1 Tax=Streptomyces sp. 7N604 TaxID=3457415 RepID=UPI003FD17EA4